MDDAVAQKLIGMLMDQNAVLLGHVLKRADDDAAHNRQVLSHLMYTATDRKDSPVDAQMEPCWPTLAPETTVPPMVMMPPQWGAPPRKPQQQPTESDMENTNGEFDPVLQDFSGVSPNLPGI